MPIHVNAKSKWKSVSVDRGNQSQFSLEGLVCVQELTDYEITDNNTKNIPEQQQINKPKKKKKRKKNLSVKQKQNDVEEKSKNVDKMHKPPRGKIVKVDNVKDIAEEPSPTESQHNPSSKKKRRKRQSTAVKNEDGAVPEKKNVDKMHKPPRGKIVKADNVKDLADEPAPTESQHKPSSKKKPQKRQSTTGKNEDGAVPEKKKKIDTEKQEECEEPIDVSAWSNLYVPEPVLTALAELGFTTPTPVQTRVLPSAIRDRMDIIGAAETGSGKTLAFGIPLIHNILQYKERIASEKQSKDANREGDSALDSGSDSDSGDDSEQIDSNIEISGNELEDEDTIDGESEEGEVIDLASLGIDVSEMDTGVPSDDESEGFDQPPSDDDFSDDQLEGTGPVRSMNNVVFPWLEEEKTLADKKAKQDSSQGQLLGLILTPTRELAIQVKNHLQALAKHTDIQIAVLVGGMSVQKQERLLRRRPEIVVATPGRLWEMIEEGEPHLATLRNLPNLVIDEADRMVEKGHFAELEKLVEMINQDEDVRKRRQTFVFSATLTLVHSGPQRVLKKKKGKVVKVDQAQKLDALVSRLGVKAQHKVIDLSRKMGTVETLTEARVNCTHEEKDIYLYYMLLHYPGRTLVFANSKDCVRRLTSILTLLGVNPLPIHADMHQRQRLKNLDKFTASGKGLLLATDVAARGLDIPHVQHVLHYQVPRTSEGYVHRSGRTARATREGISIMMIGPEDLGNYRKIIKTLNKDEDLPLFPTESGLMATVKSRVQLACQIDKLEHRTKKKNVQNEWFLKAAKEMDMDVDDDLLEDLGDSHAQSLQRQNIRSLRQQLAAMLKQPLATTGFSGKYPTKSGSLVVPYLEVSTSKTAITAVREEYKKKGPKVPVLKVAPKHKQKNKFKNKKK